MWSWCGAQGKGPTIDLVSYVSAIKINADGLCASQAQYVLRYHVKMQINKNTTNSYAIQRERDGGMISQGIGRENIQTLDPMGKSQMSKGKPINLSTTHFVFFPNHLFLLEIGWGSYFLGMGKVWRSKFELGRPPILEKCVLDYWESKSPKIDFSPIIHPCVFSLTQLEIAGAFSSHFFSIFLHFYMPRNSFWSCWVNV